MKRNLLLSCLLGVLTAATHGATFNYLSGTTPLRWNLPSAPSVPTNNFNPVTKAIRYYVASDLFSTTNATAELNAIKASFGQWEAIPGTYLKFEFAGLIDPTVGVNTVDNTNVVYWTKVGKTVNGGYDNIGYATGLTYLSFFDDNTLAEADMVLNGTVYNWFTDINDRTNSGQFVESTVSHEIGHFLGLEHSPVGAATMFWQGDTGVDAQAGLSKDEMAAARALYGRPENSQNWGTLRGKVMLNGQGALGALVTLEDINNNVVAGTLTRDQGEYLLPGISPGNYSVRVTPLDDAAANESLIYARNLSFYYATN
jgi:hypothetical protein